MQVRLTTVNFLPGKVEKAKKIYYDEIAPIVRKQKGNIDCRLLIPVNKSDDLISMTVWKDSETAEAYQKSGTYKKMVDKVRDLLLKEPVLNVYTSVDILQPSSALN